MSIELPEELVSELNSRAARSGMKLDDLVPALLRAGLRTERRIAPADREASMRAVGAWIALGEEASRELPPGPTARELLAADRWLDGWIALGTESCGDRTDGPSANEILEADRSRLERGR
jgi:plasmid stability protein